MACADCGYPSGEVRLFTSLETHGLDFGPFQRFDEEYIVCGGCGGREHCQPDPQSRYRYVPLSSEVVECAFDREYLDRPSICGVVIWNAVERESSVIVHLRRADRDIPERGCIKPSKICRLCLIVDASGTVTEVVQ